MRMAMWEEIYKKESNITISVTFANFVVTLAYFISTFLMFLIIKEDIFIYISTLCHRLTKTIYFLTYQQVNKVRAVHSISAA